MPEERVNLNNPLPFLGITAAFHKKGFVSFFFLVIGGFCKWE